MSQSGTGNTDDRREQILSLCRAVRQATDNLWLDPAPARDLERHLAAAEATADTQNGYLNPLKAIRYLLLESADGPLAPFLADAAAQIIGDGHGRLFSK